jgi:hypothetical protein
MLVLPAFIHRAPFGRNNWNRLLGTHAATSRGGGLSQRLARGDYLFDDDAPNLRAQALFVQAVARHVPDALEELAAVALSNDAEEVRQRELTNWANRRGFLDEWLVRLVEEHVAIWRRHPQFAGRWVILAMGIFRAALTIFRPDRRGIRLLRPKKSSVRMSNGTSS